MTLAIGLFIFGTIIIDSMMNIGLYLILKVYIPFEEGDEQDAVFRSLSTASGHFYPFGCTLSLA